MAFNAGNDAALAHRANLNIASAVVAKLGTGTSDSLIGHVIDQVRASHSIAELASANGMSLVVGAVDTAIARNTEINRPRNDFSAEAARAAQAAGAQGGWHGGHGLDRYDGQRGSSARFREIGGSGDGRGSGGSGSSGSGSVSALVNGVVTPAYARSFADTGIGGGTLKTFAEVGMDRGTFNQFRNEGFSKAQIADNAKDTKALGWKGKEDLSIAQHALPEARKAVIAVEQAKTAEQLAAAQAQEAAVARKVEALPDSDPRKRGTQHFFKHAIEKSQKAERHKAIGASATRDDAAAVKDNTGPAKMSSAAVQDGTMAKAAKKQTASVRATTVAGFEVEPDAPKAAAPAAPIKPVPVRIATTKPAAPAVG